jgi:hypothetical protein
MASPSAVSFGVTVAGSPYDGTTGGVCVVSTGGTGPAFTASAEL